MEIGACTTPCLSRRPFFSASLPVSVTHLLQSACPFPGATLTDAWPPGDCPRTHCRAGKGSCEASPSACVTFRNICDALHSCHPNKCAEKILQASIWQKTTNKPGWLCPGQADSLHALPALFSLARGTGWRTVCKTAGLSFCQEPRLQVDRSFLSHRSILH